MLNNVSGGQERDEAGTEGAAVPRGRRMPPEERRRQLVGIGLGLLRERPLDAITVDEVARRAGISRGLLFHYFASKQAYHQAVAAAGLRRLLRAVRTDPALPRADRLRTAIDGYLAFVERRHGRVLEMARGGWSADPELAALLRDARATIADGLLAAADGRDGAADERDGADGRDAADGRDGAADGRDGAADGRDGAAAGPREPAFGASLRTQSARAWLAFAEQLALDWVAEPSVARDLLVTHLEATFRAAVDLPD